MRVRGDVYFTFGFSRILVNIKLCNILIGKKKFRFLEKDFLFFGVGRIEWCSVGGSFFCFFFTIFKYFLFVVFCRFFLLGGFICLLIFFNNFIDFCVFGFGVSMGYLEIIRYDFCVV